MTFKQTFATKAGDRFELEMEYRQSHNNAQAAIRICITRNHVPVFQSMSHDSKNDPFILDGQAQISKEAFEHLKEFQRLSGL